MIEQGKQQIDQLQKQLNELLDEKDDKEDELRLKKYEIDVKAELELAKLATGAGLQPNDVMAIVNQMLANAAQQPELPEDDETYQHEQQEVYDPMIARPRRLEGRRLLRPLCSSGCRCIVAGRK